jgi:hypothetical protein
MAARDIMPVPGAAALEPRRRMAVEIHAPLTSGKRRGEKVKPHQAAPRTA